MRIRNTILSALLLLFITVVLQAQTISGTLTEDRTLDAASSPWQITDEVIIPDGITLTIEAGCTIYVHNHVGITVTSGGRLVAVGSPGSRITMTRRDGTSDTWDGITFDHTQTDNKLAFVDMLYADNHSHIIDVNYSRVVLDNLTWNTDDRTVLELTHPSAIIQHCTFPSVGQVEVVHGNYLSGEEYLILISNVFGPPLGYNDVIDFTDCKRPGPIFEAYNNIFLGGADDGLDLDGSDAHIEGNIFMGFHKGHDGSSTSNAIATGRRNGKTSDIVVARNIFFNNDHAVLLKENCFMIAENNTFVGSDSAAINFSEWPSRNVEAAGGAIFSGNIFWNNRAAFENQFDHRNDRDPVISVDYCLIDSALHYLGSNNIDTDPRFMNPESDFHLLPSSPAIGAGPGGLDLGAFVPPGISISGEPADSTTETSATLYLVGPGITDYKFALNDPNDTWSEERSLQEQPTIELANLVPGQLYRVYVKGKTFAGHWQTSSDYSVSKSWTVINPPALVSASSDTKPNHYFLFDNFPNPFNSTTKIQFDLPVSQQVTIQVFNALGQKKGTIANERFAAGTHEITLCADRWSSGVYYLTLTAGPYQATRRMLLVR